VTQRQAQALICYCSTEPSRCLTKFPARVSSSKKQVKVERGVVRVGPSMSAAGTPRGVGGPCRSFAPNIGAQLYSVGYCQVGEPAGHEGSGYQFIGAAITQRDWSNGGAVAVEEAGEKTGGVSCPNGLEVSSGLCSRPTPCRPHNVSSCPPWIQEIAIHGATSIPATDLLSPSRSGAFCLWAEKEMNVETPSTVPEYSVCSKNSGPCTRPATSEHSMPGTLTRHDISNVGSSKSAREAGPSWCARSRRLLGDGRAMRLLDSEFD